MRKSPLSASASSTTSRSLSRRFALPLVCSTAKLPLSPPPIPFSRARRLPTPPRHRCFTPRSMTQSSWSPPPPPRRRPASMSVSPTRKSAGRRPPPSTCRLSASAPLARFSPSDGVSFGSGGQPPKMPPSHAHVLTAIRHPPAKMVSESGRPFYVDYFTRTAHWQIPRALYVQVIPKPKHIALFPTLSSPLHHPTLNPQNKARVWEGHIWALHPAAVRLGAPPAAQASFLGPQHQHLACAGPAPAATRLGAKGQRARRLLLCGATSTDPGLRGAMSRNPGPEPLPLTPSFPSQNHRHKITRWSHPCSKNVSSV